MSALTVLIVLVVLLVLGTALTMALVQTRDQRRELEAHLRLVTGEEPEEKKPETDKDTPDIGGVGALVRHFFAFGLKRSWGMRAAPMLLFILASAGGLIAWTTLRSGLHTSLASAVAGSVAMAFLAPRFWLKRQQSAAEQQFMALFPDVIDMAIRMLRAGMPVTVAIRAVGNEAPPPVNRVFAHIADQMAIGIAFEDSLAAAAGQVGLPDFSFFAVAISLQRAAGGNLAATLNILSDIMRKRRATRLKAKAVTGEVRMSAFILGAIPLLVIGALLVMSPDYMAPLMNDPRGNMILVMAVGSLLLGFGTIRQMLRSVTEV